MLLPNTFYCFYHTIHNSVRTSSRREISIGRIKRARISKYIFALVVYRCFFSFFQTSKSNTNLHSILCMCACVVWFHFHLQSKQLEEICTCYICECCFCHYWNRFLECNTRYDECSCWMAHRNWTWTLILIPQRLSNYSFAVGIVYHINHIYEHAIDTRYTGYAFFLSLSLCFLHFPNRSPSNQQTTIYFDLFFAKILERIHQQFYSLPTGL